MHDLLSRSLLDAVTCAHTCEITPVIVVSDNGPCNKAAAFARYIDTRLEFTHVRTRRKSPQTNRDTSTSSRRAQLPSDCGEQPSSRASCGTDRPLERNSRLGTEPLRVRRCRWHRQTSFPASQIAQPSGVHEAGGSPVEDRQSKIARRST